MVIYRVPAGFEYSVVCIEVLVVEYGINGYTLWGNLLQIRTYLFPFSNQFMQSCLCSTLFASNTHTHFDYGFMSIDDNRLLRAQPITILLPTPQKSNSHHHHCHLVHPTPTIPSVVQSSKMTEPVPI